MIRRLPSRNQRSKSIKVKNVLQICLLLGVCFWLIYQIKHSHDKKKEFDEHDAKISVKEQIMDKTLRLGRKELHPRAEKITTKYEKRGEEMDEETDEEHVESNHEDEFREEDKYKREDVEQEEEEEIESVGIGEGDDIDSHEQQKVLQDFVDDGIENEDEDEEKETEENNGEDRELQVEDEHLTENQDGESVDRIIHEGQEEHYKADDASIEVAHGTHAIITETEKLRSEDSNVNIEINTLKEDNRLTNTEETGRDKKLIEENGTTLDVKFGEQKDQEDNSTILTSGEKVDASNNTSSDSILNQNGTVRSTNEDISNPPNNELEQTKNNNITEHGQFDSNSTIPIDGDRFDSNSTIPNETKNTTGFPGETLNSSNQTANVSEKTIWSDNTGELDSSGYIRLSEHVDAAARNEKSENDNKSGESDESSDSFNSNENYDTVLLHDPLDENDIDLDALPDIKTGGTSNVAVAED